MRILAILLDFVTRCRIGGVVCILANGVGSDVRMPAGTGYQAYRRHAVVGVGGVEDVVPPLVPLRGNAIAAVGRVEHVVPLDALLRQLLPRSTSDREGSCLEALDRL